MVVLFDLAGDTETFYGPLKVCCYRSFRAKRSRDPPAFVTREGRVKIAGVQDTLAFFHRIKSMGVKI